jgi:hypothetical protein
MGKSIRDIAKKGRGRPKTTGLGTGILVRMHDQLDALDAWIERQNEPGLSRPEAIRRLVEIGLDAANAPAPTSAKTSAKAKKLAGEAIDEMADPEASTAEKASRKRSLINGPEEFREMRVDRAKKK